MSLSLQIKAIDGHIGALVGRFPIRLELRGKWPPGDRDEMLVPSTVLFLKNSRASAKVSTRKRVVRVSVPWSKRYPSRLANIFFNDTMAGSGGISKVGAIPVMLPQITHFLGGLATEECMITWRFIADLHRIRAQTAQGGSGD